MLSLLDWYPDRDRDEPSPEYFDEHHVAFITMFGEVDPSKEVDVEVTGYYLHADSSVGAPSGWRVESAVIHSSDPSLDGQDVTPLLDADADALRRAENALEIARSGWVS
jgi:hypothetical protein